MMPPDLDKLKLFKRVFKVNFDDNFDSKLNPLQNNDILISGWALIGDGGQKKWSEARTKLVQIHKEYLKNDGGGYFC